MVTGLLLGLLIQPASGQSAGTLLSVLHGGSHAAPGLGGDPFLSSMDDETGWWGHLPGDAPNRISLRQIDYTPVSVETDRKVQVLGANATLISAAKRWVRGSRAFIGQLDYCTPRSRFAWHQGDARIHVSSEGSEAQGWLRLERLIPGITVQGGATLWREAALGTTQQQSIGLRGSWQSRLIGQVMHIRERHPQEVRGYLLDDLIPLTLNLQASASHYEARCRLPWELAIEGSFRHTLFAEIDSLSSAEAYELMPEGLADHWWAALHWRPRRDLGLLLRRSGLWLETTAHTYLAGMLFGKLKYLQGGLDAWMFAADYQLSAGTRLIADVEWSDLHGKTYGHIESWPFTSTVIDLLGVKQKFKAEITADWVRWHGGFTQEVGTGSISGGFNWYDIRPKMEAMTWQRVLAIGWHNVHEYELRGCRASLAALSLGFTWPYRNLRLDAGIQQFIFARTTGDLWEKVDLQPQEPQGLAAKRSSEDGRAGTFLSLTMTYGF